MLFTMSKSVVKLFQVPVVEGSRIDELIPICQMKHVLLGGSTCRRESLEPVHSGVVGI